MQAAAISVWGEAALVAFRRLSTFSTSSNHVLLAAQFGSRVVYGKLDSELVALGVVKENWDVRLDDLSKNQSKWILPI